MNKEISYRIYLLYDTRFVQDYWKYRGYIGFTSKSVETRIKGHLTEAKCSTKNTKKLNWLRNLPKEFLGFCVLKDNIPTLQEALDWEVYYIAKMKNECGMRKSLRNGDEGGYGGTKNYTSETLEKIRRSKLGNQWNKGKKYPDEIRLKLSQAKRGVKHSPESVAKRASIMRSKRGTGVIVFKKRKFSEEQILDMYHKYNNLFWSVNQIANFYKELSSTIRNIFYSKNSYMDIRIKNNLSVSKNRPKGGFGHPAAVNKLAQIKQDALERKLLNKKAAQERTVQARKKLWEDRCDLLDSMRELKNVGKTYDEIAEQFSMHRDSARRLLHGRSWAINIKNKE